MVFDISPGNLDASSAFHMMYTACKLNKQGDNIQPSHTPFPIWNQSVVPEHIYIQKVAHAYLKFNSLSYLTWQFYLCYSLLTFNVKSSQSQEMVML